MLTFNLKHPHIKNSFSVEDIYDFKNLEEPFTLAKAQAGLKDLIRLVTELGEDIFGDELSQYVTKLESSLDLYVDILFNDEDYFWDEEVTITPIGSPSEVELFEAAYSKQGGSCRLKEWFEKANELDTNDQATLYWLIKECGYDFSEAIRKLDETIVYSGTLKATAKEIFDDCHLNEIPENLRNYVDYESFAYDMKIGGDLREFEYGNKTWTAENN